MPTGNIPKSKKLAKKYQSQFTNWLNKTRRSTNTPQYAAPQAVRSSSQESRPRTQSVPQPMARLPPRPRPTMTRDLGDRTQSVPRPMASLPPRRHSTIAKDLGDGTYEIMPYCKPWPRCSYEGGRKKYKKTQHKKRHNKKTKKQKKTKSHRKLHRKSHRKSHRK